VWLGLFLRTWNLPEHGFSHYDEAHYMMESKFWRELFVQRQDLWQALRAGRLNADFVESRIDGLPPSFTPKPLHGLSIAVFSLVTGLDEEWAGSLWSALAGTVTIGLIGLWTARSVDPMTGILAAFLMAISRSHIMYSRSQLAEADAIFFATCAILWHARLCLRDRRDQAPPAVPGGLFSELILGLLYGVAVAVNYRCALILPILAVWDILVARGSARRLAALAAGFILVLCLIELPYRIYLWGGGTLPAGIQTYFQGFWARLFQDVPTASGGGSHPGSLLQPHANLLMHYAYLERSWWVVGMVMGAWACVLSRCPVRRLAAALATVPLVGFSLVARGDGPRAVMTSIPFFVIFSSIGYLHVYERLKTRFSSGSSLWQGRRVAQIVVCGLLIHSALGTWRETQVKSAWPEAGRWLRAETRSGAAATEPIYTTYPLAVRYYLRKDRAELVPKETPEDIPAGLWVIDRANAEYAYAYPVVQTVISSYKPVKVWFGQVYPNTGLFLDWGVFVRGRNWREESRRAGLGTIEVYRVPETKKDAGTAERGE